MRRAIAILSVLVMGLAACGDGESSDTTESTETTAATETTEAAAETTAAETTAAETTSAETSAPGTTAAGGSGPGSTVAAGQIDDCVVGNWVVGEEEFKRLMQQPGAEDIDATVTGDLSATFNEDGTFEYAANDLQITMSLPDMSMPEDTDISIPTEFSMQMTGTATGTYTADGDAMTVNIDENNMEMTMNGETMPGSDQMVPSSTDEYSCTEDSLEMGTGEQAFTFARG